MDVIFQERILNYLSQTVFDPTEQEEVTELTVPESLPAIDRIVDCSGFVCLHSKEVSGSTVTASGEIKACILYQSDEGGTMQRIERELPFTVKKELPASDSMQTVFYEGWIRKIDARLLGSRKVLLRVSLGSRFTAYMPSSCTVYEPPEVPRTLQLLKNSYEMNLPGDCAEKEFRMNEEAVLPETAAGIDELLKTSAAFHVEETKIVGDKAVFKGMLLVHALYTSAAGTVHSFQTELPFSQFVELNSDFEDGELRAILQLLSCEIETDGQEDSKRLLISLNVLAQATVYTKQRLELYEDAYATKGSLELAWEEVSVQARLDSQTVTVGAELTVPAMAEKVLDAALYPDQPMIRREQNTAKVIMPVYASVLYLDKDGTLQSRQSRGEITYESKLAQSAVCSASGMIYDAPVCLASYDTVTLRTAGHFQIDSYMGSRLRTVKSAALTPDSAKPSDRPSLIARKAGKESLWELAKSCGSTVEAICEANGLSGGTVQENAILLIPMQ